MERIISGWYLVYCDECGNLCNESATRHELMDLCGKCLNIIHTNNKETESLIYDENWTPDNL